MNRFKRNFRPPAAAMGLAVFGLVLAGCGGHSERPESQLAMPPAARVNVQSVARKVRIATEDVVGTVRSKLSASIDAKVSGRVAEMLVVPGQVVTNGQMLVRLDASEISSRFDQASAALTQAESDWKRASKLFAQQASARSEYDAAEARYRMAQAAAAEAKAMMNYCQVAAPFDGVITRKLADVGDLAMPGKPLLQMENPGALRLEADVPEALIGNVNLGDTLNVRVAADEDTLGGTVAEMAPAADSNSRTFLVKLDLPPAKGLRSGQFGRVAVPVGDVNSIRVPAAALVLRGQMEMVFVAASGHAELRLVKSGKRIGDEVEIVSGLDAGELIVTGGADHLVDGQPLSINP